LQHYTDFPTLLGITTTSKYLGTTNEVPRLFAATFMWYLEECRAVSCRVVGRKPHHRSMKAEA
jgi:hypothetical protein